MQLFGLIWSGPSAHYWQLFTEGLFRGRRDGATIIKKTLLDQLSYGPLCNALYMTYVALVVEGASHPWRFQSFTVQHAMGTSPRLP